MLESIDFFIPLSKQSHAGTDQCFIHLMYLGNTDVASAQMSKVVLHVVSYYPHSYFMTEQHYLKINVSTFHHI